MIPTFAILQEKIHNSIRSLGGYWPPLGASTRLLEELGELAEAVSAYPSHAEAMGDELADVLIISTCLANQYCAVLDAQPVQEHGKQTDQLGTWDKQWQQCFLRVATEAGRVGRTVNFYEGIKPLKPKEVAVSIEGGIRSLQRALVSLAQLAGIDLARAVEAKLSRTAGRDASRFIQRPDPITAPALERFRQVQQKTECVFAQKSKVWGAPEWKRGIAFEQNVLNIVPDLTRFLRVAGAEGLDGFVVEVDDIASGASIDALSRTTYQLLKCLSDCDPSGRRALDEDVSAPDWHLSYAGERLFLITFAPCYPPTNPRYSFGVQSTLFFFQPESSFLVKLNQERERNGQIHQLIRDRYFAAGRRYDLARFGEPGSHEAYRFVKPLNGDDPAVRWWDAK